MKKKDKWIVVRVFDEADNNGENHEGEYKEFPSVAAAKRWLKEPEQVEWMHEYELKCKIYKVIPI